MVNDQPFFCFHCKFLWQKYCNTFIFWSDNIAIYFSWVAKSQFIIILRLLWTQKFYWEPFRSLCDVIFLTLQRTHSLIKFFVLLKGAHLEESIQLFLLLRLQRLWYYTVHKDCWYEFIFKEMWWSFKVFQKQMKKFEQVKH